MIRWMLKIIFKVLSSAPFGVNMNEGLDGRVTLLRPRALIF
jgi:hypothetical protein